MKIGFLSLLALLFIGLKLTHFIAWSWIWVLAPLWLGLVIFLGVVALIFLFGIVAALLEQSSSTRRRR